MAMIDSRSTSKISTLQLTNTNKHHRIPDFSTLETLHQLNLESTLDPWNQLNLGPTLEPWNQLNPESFPFSPCLTLTLISRSTQRAPTTPFSSTFKSTLLSTV
uniref:Uncharacterized protein n=1 Tax=Cacopsylla melanoneura TaxID=428564 RepID=A0A8D8TPB2_9HEMI